MTDGGKVSDPQRATSQVTVSKDHVPSEHTSVCRTGDPATGKYPYAHETSRLLP
jgi:hypothetical protein